MARVKTGQTPFYPLVFRGLALGGIFWVLLAPFRLIFKTAHIPEPVEEVEHALGILHDAEEREKGAH